MVTTVAGVYDILFGMRRCRINLPNRCYHLRAYAECGMMLAESGYVDAKAESGYVDANPVNAGIVDWPDGYEWCSYAAACRGNETARSGRMLNPNGADDEKQN